MGGDALRRVLGDGGWWSDWVRLPSLATLLSLRCSLTHTPRRHHPFTHHPSLPCTYPDVSWAAHVPDGASHRIPVSTSLINRASPRSCGHQPRHLWARPKPSVSHHTTHLPRFIPSRYPRRPPRSQFRISSHFTRVPSHRVISLFHLPRTPPTPESSPRGLDNGHAIPASPVQDRRRQSQA